MPEDEEFEVDHINVFQEILDQFKLKAQCIIHRRVRNASLYSLRLFPGCKLSHLTSLTSELSLALKSKGLINFRPILEEGIVRAEVMDDANTKINLIDELKNKVIPNYILPVFLGSSIDGEDMWMDLAKNPHLLIAGTTGSGKSVLLHTILTNTILLSKAKVFIIDTKALEFDAYTAAYSNVSVATNYTDACHTLEILLEEMESRYEAMREMNKVVSPFDPIVLMIDEFADLIMQDKDNEFYNLLCRLTQKSRASGIHAVVATQRPSADIIQGVIKANLPAKIACKVQSKLNSRVILDQNGAELLVGNGDAIISNYEHDMVRFQAAFTSSKALLESGATRADFVFDTDIQEEE